MAASLQQQIHQLEELSQVQQRFVSDVSHELRTPLTTVRMAGDVLHDAREDFDPAAARSAELLQTQLDRFEALLADLLEISRYDAGAAVLDAEPVDLRDVVAARRRATPSRSPSASGTRSSCDAARRAAASPRSTAAGSSASCATCSSTRSSTARAAGRRDGRPRTSDAVAVAVRDHGVGLTPGEAAHGVRPVLAGRPGAGADHRRHRPGPGHLAGGRAPARRLAAGLGRAGRGRRVPAHAAPRAPATVLEGSPLPLVPEPTPAPDVEITVARNRGLDPAGLPDLDGVHADDDVAHADDVAHLERR